MRKFAVVLIAILLAGCSGSDNGVRVTAEKPAVAVPAQKARNEPIFYNGKTYQLAMAPLGGGLYDLSVGGMTAEQQKDAVAVATSSLRYFSCPDGKTGKLTNQPRYANSAWRMSARCG